MVRKKDDRIFVSTRIVAAGVILVLLLALVALYIFPDHTDTDFSWTILPRTSAILIGAGYTAGAYFFARVLTEKHWHRVQAGFLPITGFTICMLAVTLLHWGRFHQGTFNFYLWTVIYILTPFLVPILWWRNQSAVSLELEDHDFRFPLPIRWGLGLISLIGVLVCLFFFIQPSGLITIAPWKLSALTARVFAGWSILTLLTLATIAWDGRWSATRILLESALVSVVLTLAAMPRMWNDFDPANPMTFVFLLALAVTLVAFVVIHLWLDRISRGS